MDTSISQKRPFEKPPTTYKQQVDLLKERGMIIPDEAEASFYLEHLNYYRIGAYWLPFELDHGSHTFEPGTSFQDVLSLYRFDRELRLLMLDAIERVEVSVRAHWAYLLAHHYGSHAHLEQRFFNVHYYFKNRTDLKKEVERSQRHEDFIKHLMTTYQEELPPIWAICEVMSLGLLSRWYSSLKKPKIKKLVAKPYGLPYEFFESWLHHLAIVRNISAHHGRLWNRVFPILKAKSKHVTLPLIQDDSINTRKLYNTLLILLHLMDIIAPSHSWRKRLKTLLLANERVLPQMGFPVDWKQQLIWQ